jgi:hypothetical protein
MWALRIVAIYDDHPFVPDLAATMAATNPALAKAASSQRAAGYNALASQFGAQLVALGPPVQAGPIGPLPPVGPPPAPPPLGPPPLGSDPNAPPLEDPQAPPAGGAVAVALGALALVAYAAWRALTRRR